jgi:hypothetical protein
VAFLSVTTSMALMKFTSRSSSVVDLSNRSTGSREGLGVKVRVVKLQ